MNQQQRAVVQQAIEALEYQTEQTRPIWKTEQAITALRQLLEQPVQEPVAWMNPHGGFLSATYIEKFASGLDKETHNIPLYTSPPAQQDPADAIPSEDIAKDAARYQWLRCRMIGADYDWNESGTCCLVFEWPKDVPLGASCDKNIDAAIGAAHGITAAPEKGGAK